jgi:hypothetical protein
LRPSCLRVSGRQPFDRQLVLVIILSFWQTWKKKKKISPKNSALHNNVTHAPLKALRWLIT